MTCGCGKNIDTETKKPLGKCCCNPKTVCKEVCERGFDGWVNAAKIKLIKCGKYVKLTFTDVRSFTLYQTYNKYNKSLNCNRQILKIGNSYYDEYLDYFKNRTCYLEFQSCNNKHIQFSFYFKCGKYDETSNVWTWTVKPDKLFVNDVLITDYQKYYGTNVQCSLDNHRPGVYCRGIANVVTCSKHTAIYPGKNTVGQCVYYNGIIQGCIGVPDSKAIKPFK